MSHSNEYYLQRIETLEKENQCLKQQNEIANNNLRIRMHQLTLAQEELYYTYKHLRANNAMQYAGEWHLSQERQTVINSFLITQEARQQEIVSETDERSCKKHNERQEACAAFKECV